MNHRANNATENSTNKWLIVLAVCAILFGIYHAYGFFSGPSVASLTYQALNGPTPEQQHSAAAELAKFDPVPIEALRKVSCQSENPGVVSICILKLSRERDYESMDLFLEKLDDENVSVRAAAAKVATQLLGRDFHFPVSGKKDKRDFIRDQIIEEWKAYEGSELAKHNEQRYAKEN